MRLNPYLNFNGQCEAAFQLYQKVLNGKNLQMFRFADMPPSDEMPIPISARQQIMHASMEVGAAVLMGSDNPHPGFQPAQGFAVSLNMDSAEEAERVFAALSEGGQVTMPLAQTFWALRFGMFTDRFGTPWMINCEQERCSD